MGVKLLVRGSAVAACCVATALFIKPATAQTVVGDYRLHAGDQIEVSVWNEEQLQRTLIIRPDGKFSFPLAGDIVAGGRTIAEVRGDIETRLRAFISEPVVTVSVTDVGGNRVYVIGQVNKPGVFTMNPQLTVLQALSVAGGMTPFAKLDEIVVIRGPGAAQRTIRFNYGQISSGRDLSQNIALESGDVVLVP